MQTKVHYGVKACAIDFFMDGNKLSNSIVIGDVKLAETKLYDQALGHIALRRVPLDLDDGVKINYEMFQGVEVAREGQKTLSIDLLGKI